MDTTLVHNEAARTVTMDEVTWSAIVTIAAATITSVSQEPFQFELIPQGIDIAHAELHQDEECLGHNCKLRSVLAAANQLNMQITQAKIRAKSGGAS